MLVHIDDDREPEGDREPADDGSAALGGYPVVADREPPYTTGSVGGADAAGASAEDDGVLHTESREPESLDE